MNERKAFSLPFEGMISGALITQFIRTLPLNQACFCTSNGKITALCKFKILLNLKLAQSLSWVIDI